jgi:3-oxoadipate enol-lactonase
MPKATVHGVSIYYELRGDPGSSRTVAFFNGILSSTSSWYEMCPAFEQMGYRVLLHDLRGQLKSHKPTGAIGFADHVSDTLQLFDHLGIEQAHCIGTSYGSVVAQQTLLAAPERVGSLSLINGLCDTDARFRFMVENFIAWARAVLEAEPHQRVLYKKRFITNFVPIIYSPYFINSFSDEISKRIELYAEVPDDYFTGVIPLFRNAIELHGLVGRLHSVERPVFILCGNDDFLTPVAFSERIHAAIPHSTLMILPNTGHAAAIERPEFIATALQGLINGIA